MSVILLEATAHAFGCEKVGYSSRAKALLAMDRIRLLDAQHHRVAMPGKNQKRHRRLRRSHPSSVCRAYECPMCGLWHLTSQRSK